MIEIEVYFSGALGRSPLEQAQLVVDGVADIAFVVPGLTPERFHDNAVIELPGLFRDLREATLVYSRLVEANRLKGYQELFVIGAYASEPESLHARVPITALDSLKGKKMRVNNATEGLALGKFGSQSVVMPVNRVAESISGGRIDGATVPLSTLLEFGIGRVATHHYFLRTSSAPLALHHELQEIREPAGPSPGHHSQVQRRMGGRALHRGPRSARTQCDGAIASRRAPRFHLPVAD